MAHDSLGTHNEPQYAETGVPADAADLTEVAAYAAKVGNAKVGPTADRNSATGADVWPGLLWYDTDLNQYFSYNSGWVMVITPDTTANISAFSTGWSSLTTAGHIARVRRHGNHVSLYGAIVFGTGANYNSMFTVPTGFAPATTAAQFIGTAIVSVGSGNGAAVALLLSNGVVSTAGAGYSTASLPANAIVTLGGCSWWMD